MKFSLGLIVVALVCLNSATSNPAEPRATPLTTKYKYGDALSKSLLFYYAQRSGKLPADDNPVPWRKDSALKDKGEGGEDLTGGYYDAGDYVKFNFPMAASTTLIAWSIVDFPDGYTSTGQMDRARKTVRWATDYFMKCHVAPNKFYGQVGDGNVDHSYWGRPEDMTMNRPAFYISDSKPGSDLAGEAAASLAAASMVFSSADSAYAAKCLTHAKQLYALAKNYKGKYDQSITNAASFYPSSGFGDELAWAAVWLYRATKDATYLNDAKAFYSQYSLSSNPGQFSWDNKNAGVQVLMAKVTGADNYKKDIQAFCDAKVSAPKTPKGLLFIDKWGSLRHASNVAFICLNAAELNINPTAYRQLAQKQIHYALGDAGRSYVVGFGNNPPVRPHHASSSCPDAPASCSWGQLDSPSPNPRVLNGALVGGPDQNDNYSDVRKDYVMNEVACDYNAGFQGALAGLQQLAQRGTFH